MTLYTYANETLGQVATKQDVEKALTATALENKKIGAAEERARILEIANSDKLAGNGAAFKTAITLAADAPEMNANKVIGHALRSSESELAPVAATNPAALANRTEAGEFDVIGAFASSAQCNASNSNALPNAADVYASRCNPNVKKGAE